MNEVNSRSANTLLLKCQDLRDHSVVNRTKIKELTISIKFPINNKIAKIS